MSVSLKINSRRWTRSIFADEGEYDLENELNDFFGRTGKFYFSLFLWSAVRARSRQSHAQIGHERTGTGLDPRLKSLSNLDDDIQKKVKKELKSQLLNLINIQGTTLISNSNTTTSGFQHGRLHISIFGTNTSNIVNPTSELEFYLDPIPTPIRIPTPIANYNIDLFKW
ncbi:hypothetical protein Glove_353g25 [Diversispora epigaea]|uniref:Uncharacterized protein n=1 Tax=Diversispora epigaea TaxID=1348612 RepID=A0A397HJ22_9GLOM|nr:hypothetical protein Glove_353g25 [Diversispora epigaea]